MPVGLAENESFPPEAPVKCPRCPRLVAYRMENETDEPSWFNGAVPSFGSETARLVIVGLAPGRNGANRTGRPFTGDYAGVLLYETLLDFHFARGNYDARPDDGVELLDCLITNSVRCVPPQNKPEPKEIATCRPFFQSRLAHLPRMTILLALGRIAHEQTLTTLGKRKALFPFAHGSRHQLEPNLAMFDSFHCSRYNTNTGRLTREMFRSVFAAIRGELDSGPAKVRARGKRADERGR
ncbi:uracil-DNA glycosylase [Hyphomicrobium methylovorum]|uniref:uracil-DNA glycosylase n=1 Tax=Hyphomicrobium methylovorum TaxID=84 RepID=UPI0015E655DA|nr:uracil-DNA glycosylase [Hyphomicrobium methylovorum]MBA2125269.1 uracil-DNA glycosylase [Hyphomicrobium methylovorum]